MVGSRPVLGVGRAGRLKNKGDNMKTRTKRRNIIWRTLFNDNMVEGGGYKAKFSLAKLAILTAIIVGSLVILQLTGTLNTIVKLVQAVF